jgi:pyruvate dehydrogenase E2 component (dihydrolipoamide acetyltransferase)
MQIPLPDARRKGVMPLTGPRKIIAQRMAYSAATAPHITLSIGVDMSEAARLRARVLAQIEQKTGQRLSFTAILARALAAVLPRHPLLNASLAGEEIILWEDVHLGIATSLEEYLIVPVIRQAQDQNLEQIVARLADLVERARNKRLAPSEMSGSTFTISNLGMFGIESFTAIINPPESAILAVGKIVDTFIKVENEMVMRPVMNLTLSADHRIVDGAAAAHFLVELKNTLENPYLLI